MKLASLNLQETNVTDLELFANPTDIRSPLTHDLARPLFRDGGGLGGRLTGPKFTHVAANTAKGRGQTGVRLARRGEKARPWTVPGCAPDW